MKRKLTETEMTKLADTLSAAFVGYILLHDKLPDEATTKRFVIEAMAAANGRPKND